MRWLVTDLPLSSPMLLIYLDNTLLCFMQRMVANCCLKYFLI